MERVLFKNVAKLYIRGASFFSLIYNLKHFTLKTPAIPRCYDVGTVIAYPPSRRHPPAPGNLRLQIFSKIPLDSQTPSRCIHLFIALHPKLQYISKTSKLRIKYSARALLSHWQIHESTTLESHTHSHRNTSLKIGYKCITTI